VLVTAPLALRPPAGARDEAGAAGAAALEERRDSAGATTDLLLEPASNFAIQAALPGRLGLQTGQHRLVQPTVEQVEQV
jgi:hypothetical protein